MRQRPKPVPAKPVFRTPQEKFDAIVARAVPSQLPTNVTRESYNRMLLHATTEGGLWACAKNGARVKAKMWYRTVIDRATNEIVNTHIPVAVLFCDGCDTAPNHTAEEAIFSDAIQTVAL